MKRKKGAYRSFRPEEYVNPILGALKRDLVLSQMQEGAKDPALYFRDRQISEFLKKSLLRPNERNTSLSEKSITSFLDRNHDLSNFDRDFVTRLHEGGFDPTDRVRRAPFGQVNQKDVILSRARNLIHWILDPLCESSWFTECRHSSGVSVGLSYTMTNLEDKMQVPMSVTLECLPYITRCLGSDIILSNAGVDYNSKDSYVIVAGSRLTTVPKDDTKLRIIAVEPTANMYLQQGLAAIMTRKLEKVGISLGNQQFLHHRLAAESSVTHVNATLDLSNASDTISFELVRYLFPKDWFTALSGVRSSRALIDENIVDLHTYATMGNATTFPVETLVFYAIAVASVSLNQTSNRSLLIEHQYLNSVSVFGDDIICPTASALTVIESLEYCGFSLNRDKSFYFNDHFRESCGADFLDYRSVRPYYVRGPVSLRVSSLEPWLYTMFNGLLKKYISYFGERNYAYQQLWQTFGELFSSSGITLKIVPDVYPDDSGLKISEDFFRFQNLPGYRLSSISRSNDANNSYCIYYCSFQYRNSGPKNPLLRYWQALRAGHSDDTQAKYIKKKGGGYVVKKSYVSNMTLNTN